jgi:hypothetical protein
MIYELSDKRYGKIHVIKRTGKSGKWLCECECGKTVLADSHSLMHGKITSCGCGRGSKGTHRKSKTKIYRIWSAMKTRCLNPNVKCFSRYGGRGITICSRWMKFENFYADMGDVPNGKTLDRKNNSKGYSSKNCKWSSLEEQANNKRNNHLIKIDGRTTTLAIISKEYGVKSGYVLKRLKRGMSIIEALKR